MTDEIASSKRIDWGRDELIVALDVYLCLEGTVPDPKLRQVRDLSNLLRKAELYSPIRQSNFRSPASVVMKLMNFRSIDPGYVGKGLAAGSRLDREMWQEFAGDRVRLSKVATAIRGVLSAGAGGHSTDRLLADCVVEAEEGAVLTRLHQIRERDARLVQAKKRAVLKDAGRLLCEVCGFCFETSYGALGAQFIECHHRWPLSDLRWNQKTRLEDLALLRANCHRMIHGCRPWRTVEELKLIVEIQSRKDQQQGNHQ